MKTLKILFSTVIFVLFTWITFASNVENIEVIDSNSIEITTSTDLLFSNKNIEWELKILKDLPISFSTRDITDQTKVLLNLSSDLIPNTSYSLITIIWWEWNIDFRTNESLIWEYINENLIPWTESIEKIVILDNRTIEIYFTNDLIEEVFEFKILSELKINSLLSEWNNNVINLELTDNLEKSTDYIIMFMSLKDIMWETVFFEEDLYSFYTTDNLEQDINIDENNDYIIQEIEQAPIQELEQLSIQENNIESTWWMIENWMWNWELKEVEEIAMKTNRTPDTWTTTSILIVLTLLTSFGLFLRKRFEK